MNKRIINFVIIFNCLILLAINVYVADFTQTTVLFDTAMNLERLVLSKDLNTELRVETMVNYDSSDINLLNEKNEVIKNDHITNDAFKLIILSIILNIIVFYMNNRKTTLQNIDDSNS